MFRLKRLFLNPEFLFRISPPSPQNSHITKVRHVKFRRPWVKRFLSTCLIYGTAFHLWSSFVLLHFDDTLHDIDVVQHPGGDSEETTKGPRNRAGNEDGKYHSDGSGEVEDSSPIFIPLGWPRSGKGELYAASDPEWQEFVKISQDRERLQALRDELSSIVLCDASRSNILSRILGGPLAVTGFWLVHHFPARAPPQYSRSGLEITDNGISWKSRPIPSEDGDLLRKCMRPLFVTLGIRDAYMIFLKRQLGRLNLIWKEQSLDIAQQRHQIRGMSTDLRTLDGLSRVSQADTSQRIPEQSSPGSQQKTHQGSEDTRLHSSFLLSTLQRLPVPKFGPGSDLYAASLAFKMRLNDCWARETHTPPRGVFYFIGPVGLKGPRGFCRVEVKGEYDPMTGKWTLVSMQLKDLNVFNQKALGGQ